MTVQRDNLDVVTGAEVVEAAESVLEGTPVADPEQIPAPPTEAPDTKPEKKEDPEVTPMCCGGGPGHPLVGRFNLSEGEIEHDPTCPNHPDHKAS